MPDTKEKLLVLLDGHALIHRAFHAFQGSGGGLSMSKTGEQTSAVFGFTTALLKAITDLKPDNIVVAFDHPTPTFRSKQFEAYKAHRPPMPDELRAQIGRVREMVQAFGITAVELPGYEADDVLGCLARQATEKGLHTTIISLDSDLFQLVTPTVNVLFERGPQGTHLYDEERVRERYGLEPIQIIDLKALKGDSSDNIPGVRGVGDKAATALLQTYATVEEIYDNIDVVAPARVQKLLREGEEAARQGKELTTIVTDLPIELDLEATAWNGYERDNILPLFRELEFTSLASRLVDRGDTPATFAPPTNGAAASAAFTPTTTDPVTPAEQAATYHIVTTADALNDLVTRIRTAKAFAFDTETTALSPMRAQLVGISVAIDADDGYYIPVGHMEGDQIPKDAILDAFRPIFADDDIAKIAHNGQYDMSILLNDGIQTQGFAFDTMIAAHLMGENVVGLKPLAFQRLNVEMTPIVDLIGRGKKQLTMDMVAIEKAAPYAAADAVMTYRLWEQLQTEIRGSTMEDVFHNVEMPLIPVLMRMERAGIALESSLLSGMAFDFRQKIQELEERIYHEAGDRFNINSTQQLAVVLFEKLNLPGSKRTKSGYSTDASVLESLRGAHPIVALLLDYRELSKLLSTYIDALPAQIDPVTSRVHTSFNQTGSATGRVSSNDPNLQNIPVRTDTGRRIRNAFIASKPENILLAADYSQVELRVLAHLSMDPGMIRAFENDEDIHAATASEVQGVPIGEVTPQMRRVAKMVNFGIAYGVTKFGLATRLEIGREEAGTFIDTYFERYPKVRDYVEATKVQARADGYVETLLGRRRYIPDINASNRSIREGAERMAINMPVQGTAADILKVAMVRLQDRLDDLDLDAPMLLQIHDELIFELPEVEREPLTALVQEIMPNAMTLAVPLKVDIKTGRSWGELE